MIVDHVEEGAMLSTSWETHRHDPSCRANLFRDLSRIMLSLAQIPLPRIASWTIDDCGTLSLTNRPLTLTLHQLENEGIPTNIARNLTYPATEGYYLDLLACHDSVIRHKPNAILDEDDGEAQLSALTMMKAVLPHSACRELRYGPFVLALTDLYQSNIFVDDDWNVTKLIDLEWSCALPVEMIHPPYWFTSQGIDTLEGTALEEYARVRGEFMDIFEEEEKKIKLNTCPTPPLTNTIHRGWQVGTFWYFSALHTPAGLYNLFFDKIQPRFVGEAEACSQKKAFTDFEEVVAPYWSVDDTAKMIDAKIRESEVYADRLRKVFAEGTSSRESEEETAGKERKVNGQADG